MQYRLLEQDLWKCADCEVEQSGSFPARCPKCGSNANKIWQLSLVKASVAETSFLAELEAELRFTLVALRPFLWHVLHFSLLYFVLMNPFSVSVIFWLSEYKLEGGMPAWEAFAVLAGYGSYAACCYQMFKHLYLMISSFCWVSQRAPEQYAYGIGRVVDGR